MGDLNRRLTLPSVALQRGHSSLLSSGAGLYTVRRQLGQFRYAMGRTRYPPPGGASTYG